jgi:hypothetical protein
MEKIKPTWDFQINQPRVFARRGVRHWDQEELVRRKVLQNDMKNSESNTNVLDEQSLDRPIET